MWWQIKTASDRFPGSLRIGMFLYSQRVQNVHRFAKDMNKNVYSALSIIAPNWKLPICPSAIEQINKMCDVHVREYTYIQIQIQKYKESTTSFKWQCKCISQV